MDPISPSAYWDGIAEAWAARPRQRLWRRYSDVLHSRLVAEWLPSTPVKRILKTPAFDEATGELGRFLVQATGGALLVTLDVSMTTLRQARERHHGLSPLAGSVRRLPLSDASFDLVVSTSTLDHLASLDEDRGCARRASAHTPAWRAARAHARQRHQPRCRAAQRAAACVAARAAPVLYETGANCGPGRLKALVRGSGLTPIHVGSLLHCPRMPAVALSHAIESLGSGSVADAYVRALDGVRRLGRLPTRYANRYFVAVVADCC